MAAATGPGGLDLSALATAAGTETSTRVAGSSGMLAAALDAMLQEQRAQLTAEREGQDRENTFTRAQSMLDEALAQREAALQRAARDREAANEPDWFTQQRFQTDENIRQAMILSGIERQAAKEQAAEEARISLEEFGDEVISPDRGQAILQSDPRRSRYTLSEEDRAFARELYSKPENRDPFILGELLRQEFDKRYAGQTARKGKSGWKMPGTGGAELPWGGRKARKARPDTREFNDERASLLLRDLFYGISPGG